MPMPITGQFGFVPNNRVSGGQTALQLPLGEIAISEVQPRYAAMNWSGQVFSASLFTAAAISTYIGAAGGTPAIGVYNPVGSGKNIVPLFASYNSVVAPAAAGSVAWNLFFGATSAVITQTPSATYPISQLTLQKGASVAQAFINVALTSGGIANGVIPLGSAYWATAAGAALLTPPVPADLSGQLIIPPGAYMALGGSAALTSATWQAFLSWAELPI
jgi:hypothetical protein